MTTPIKGGSDPSNVDSSSVEPVVDASYNPFLAALLASNISTSTAESSVSTVESGSPKLPVPVTGDALYRKMRLRADEILSSMLDTWLENLDKISELLKEDQKKQEKVQLQHKKAEALQEKYRDERTRSSSGVVAAGGDIWQTGVASLIALYVEDSKKVSATTAAADPNVNPVGAVQSTGTAVGASDRNIGDLSGHHPSSAMTSALMIGAGFLGDFKTSEAPGAVQLNNKVLQDAWNQIAIAHNPNDPATQVAGWVSALWGVGLSYFTAAKEVGELDAGKKEPAKDLEFAVKYAENLIAGLASGQFMAHIKAIVVSNTQPGERVDQQHVDKLCNMGKVILLTVALAQIMKLELGASFKEKVYEGHISGDAVVDMLLGKVDFQTNDPQGLAVIKAKLIMQINTLMVQLPESDRAALMVNIRTYFNTNPSIEKLSDANAVVSGVFAASDIEERHLEQNRM